MRKLMRKWSEKRFCIVWELVMDSVRYFDVCWVVDVLSLIVGLYY